MFAVGDDEAPQVGEQALHLGLVGRGPEGANQAPSAVVAVASRLEVRSGPITDREATWNVGRRKRALSRHSPAARSSARAGATSTTSIPDSPTGWTYRKSPTVSPTASAARGGSGSAPKSRTVAASLPRPYSSGSSGDRAGVGRRAEVFQVTHQPLDPRWVGRRVDRLGHLPASAALPIENDPLASANDLHAADVGDGRVDRARGGRGPPSPGVSARSGPPHSRPTTGRSGR